MWREDKRRKKRIKTKEAMKLKRKGKEMGKWEGRANEGRKG